MKLHILSANLKFFADPTTSRRLYHSNSLVLNIICSEYMKLLISYIGNYLFKWNGDTVAERAVILIAEVDE